MEHNVVIAYSLIGLTALLIIVDMLTRLNVKGSHMTALTTIIGTLLAVRYIQTDGSEEK